MTHLPPEWLFRLKAATRDLVKRAGGEERAAEICDRGTTTIHRWGSADHPDLIPLGCALLLERETGAPLVTRAMAEFNGLGLSPRDGGGAQSFAHSFARVARESAEVAAAVAEAQADGVISPNEAKAIDREAAQAQDALADLRAQIAGAAGHALRVVGDR